MPDREPPPDDLFGPGGALARVRHEFEFRGGQQRMAAAVSRAFAERRSLVVEAGTGTGKTLAYLVPALLADAPVVISTGTKALQQQIVDRELPVARAVAGAAGGEERHVVVLKGRENYLCVRRLAEFESAPLLDSAGEIPLWPKIVAWSRTTASGDRAEIAGLPDQSPLWARLDARADICTGQKCPDYDRCWVVLKRREAAEAQVVIVNHHLLFADLALRRTHGARILPEAPLLVLDEAHLAEDAAASHFGERLTGRMLVDLAGDCEAELAKGGRDATVATSLERAGRALFRALRPPRDARVHFVREAFLATHAELVDVVLGALDLCASALGGAGERAEERELLMARCAAHAAALTELLQPPPVGRVVTVEAQGRDGALLASWPLDLRELLAETLGVEFASVVATSATLAIGGSLERARTNLGLSEAGTLVVRSPFDHARQAALYVPADFPEPNTREFAERALREIEELLTITDGRALVLFASHRALREAAAAFAGRLPWPVLVQGDAPREQLVDAFRGTTHSVLLGTASFRQGIDVPGEALSLVIVDKLPFAVPDDPLVAARGRLIEERGGHAFGDDMLPEAILALKQGLGRLIRTRSDRGLLALLDVRVRRKSYGRTVLASLPPWPLVGDLEQARAFFGGRR